jgi:hypothetical protein
MGFEKRRNKMNKIEIKTEDYSPLALIKKAIEGNVSIEILQKLFDLQERFVANQARQKYCEDMVIVQNQIPLIMKSLRNNHTKSKYASLDDIILKTKEIYTENGFAISFSEGISEKTEYVRIIGTVTHSLGHKEVFFYDIPLDGKGIAGNANMTAIHSKGSSTSYARRYLMCMIWNIPTGDDNDGNNGLEQKPIEYISDSEKSNILDLINEKSIPIERFLKAFAVEELDKFPKSKYEVAIARLKSAVKK